MTVTERELDEIKQRLSVRPARTAAALQRARETSQGMQRVGGDCFVDYVVHRYEHSPAMPHLFLRCVHCHWLRLTSWHLLQRRDHRAT